MYKKSCPYCKGVSYSAASIGQWKCPYCEADLTIFVPEIAGTAAPENGVRDHDLTNPGTNIDGAKANEQARNKLVLLSGGKIKPQK